MTTRNIKIGISALVLLCIIGLVWYKTNSPAVSGGGGDTLTHPTLDLPASGSTNKSPLQVAGIAPGPWYFEASFPIELRATDGTILGVAPAHATEEWMTTGPVHFSTTIPFKVSKKTEAVLILKKDNPSGDPKNDASYEVPVTLIP